MTLIKSCPSCNGCRFAVNGYCTLARIDLQDIVISSVDGLQFNCWEEDPPKEISLVIDNPLKVMPGETVEIEGGYIVTNKGNTPLSISFEEE